MTDSNHEFIEILGKILVRRWIFGFLLMFDRAGKIVGQYQKVHAAVDHFEGEPPWSKPPSGNDTGWFPETFRILSLKGAEILVWINGRRGTVEDFIVKSATFQNEVALIATNQSYGAGTMIGQWPARIMAACPEPKENYIIATISLEQVRQARKHSRNVQQRRPELYTEITNPLPPASGNASEGRSSP